MGETLVGQDNAARESAERAGTSVADLFGGTGAQFGTTTSNIGNAMQRLATQAQMQIAGGMSPDELGTGEAIQRALADPTDRTEGLFRSLEPFEERSRERSVRGLRASMGRAGGRFSRNLLGAESRMRGELEDRFRRSREESLLQAQGQQNQALGMVLSNLLGARQTAQQGVQGILGPALGFAREGARGTSGLLPGLIQAGATLGGTALAGPAGGAGGSALSKELLSAMGMGGGGGRLPSPPRMHPEEWVQPPDIRTTP